MTSSATSARSMARRRANEGVVLDVLVDLAFLAQARGVDNGVVLAVMLDDGVDGVARGAGDVGHDGAVGRGQAVGQRGLTGVGAADDGDVDAAVLFLGAVSTFFRSSTTASSRSPVPWPCNEPRAARVAQAQL